MVSDHCYESKFKFSLQHIRNAKGQKVNTLPVALYKQRIGHAGVISAAAHRGNSVRQSHYVFVPRILFFPTGLKRSGLCSPRSGLCAFMMEGMEETGNKGRRKDMGVFACWYLGEYFVFGECFICVLG